MVRRAFFLLGATSLLAAPAAAQFGVPKKPGSTFQEMQEKAQNEGLAGLGQMDMDMLANMDVAEMQKLIQEAMTDPQVMEAMNDMNSGVNEAMESLSNMSPEELEKQMLEGLSMLTSDDIMQNVMGNKDEVLQTLAAQGLVDEAKIQQYKDDPELFEKEMKDAFAQMKDIFSDPQTLQAATQMMKGMGEIMSDPQGAMQQLAASMEGALGDDDKIEEARLQLLTDPDKAGSPLLAEMFKGDEMKEILQDPVKWREQVKKGQGMLMGGDDGAGQGAGVGEL